MIDVGSFVSQLKNYPRDNIPEKILNNLKKIISRDDFVPDLIRTKAKPAADMASWCIAMNTYANVSKKVEPKKKKVAEMMAILDQANKELAVKEGELLKVKQAVKKLQQETAEMA